MPPKKSKGNAAKKLDQLDIKIIKDLLKNSRKSFSQIAKECKVTTATVNNRFKELKEAGIIEGSTAIVDLANLDVECDSYILININPSQLKEFIRDAKTMFGEFFVTHQKLNDKYNVRAWSPIKNIKDLEEAKGNLKQHSAVIDISTNIWTYMKVMPDNLAIETNLN
jgi:DNA-binding Lrp family transcriptional regulator